MIDETKTRADFEAFVSAPPFERDVDRIPDDPGRFSWPGRYESIATELAWLAWFEAWQAGQERANDAELRCTYLRVMLGLLASLAYPFKSKAEIDAEIDRQLALLLAGPFEIGGKP